MQRSRRNNPGGDDDASTASARARRSPRRQGSFAQATASSLAHGGPDAKAPAVRAKSAKALLLAKFDNTNGNGGSNGNVGGGGGGDSSGGGSEKENSANGSDDGSTGSSGNGTPAKAKRPSANNSNDNECVLSPTPYWQVLRERGVDKTSPRTTRSAAAKQNAATAAVLRDLNHLEDDSSSSDDDNNSEEEHAKFSPTMLSFSPPGRQLQLQQEKAAKKRRDAEAEKERVRLAKIRKAQVAGMGLNNSAVKKRRAKKPRKGSKSTNSNNAKSDGSNDCGLAAAVSGVPPMPTGPSTEDMRLIMAQSLQEHNSARMEGLIAKSASAERDAAHYKQRYEELAGRYDALLEEQRIKSSSNKCSEAGSELNKVHELSLEVGEQKGLIDGYEQKIVMLEERQRHDQDAFIKERKRLEAELARAKEEHVEELHAMTAEVDSQKESRHQTEEKDNALQAELELTQSKLNELVKANEELDVWDRENGNREELLARRFELEKAVADLTTRLADANAANESCQETIATLQANVSNHLDTISDSKDIIAQLEANLQSSKDDLESTKRKMAMMHSPNSKDALEQELSTEIGSLENKLAAKGTENAELQDQLREKDEECQELMGELDEVKGQNEELHNRLGESNGNMEDSKLAAEELESENAQLAEQVKSVTAKYEQNEGQLEEIAMENEDLASKLESTRSEMQTNIEGMAAQADKQVGELKATFDAISAEKDLLDEHLQQAKNDISDLKSQLSNLGTEFSDSQQETANLQTEKKASDKKLTELSGQCQTLTDHLESAQSTIASLEAKLRAKDEYCEQFTTIEQRLTQEKCVLNEIRRDLHNRVMQLSGNIRVFVRVRPLIESERRLVSQQQSSANNNRRQTMNRPSSSNGRPSSRGSMMPSGRPLSRGSMVSSQSHRSLPASSSQPHGEAADECPFHFPSIADRDSTNSLSTSAKASPNYTSFHDLTKQTIELTEPYKDRGGLNPRRKKWKYGFDRVFNQEDGQDDVWGGAAPLVQSCVDGFHVCMFAYGQTSSGKTHTMIGDAQKPGLIPRSVEKLFAAKQDIEQSSKGEGVSVDIRVELLEVYNEEVRDLLDDNAGPDGQLIKLKLSSNEAVGNVKVDARDEQEVAGILQLAQERRCVKATKSNAESSRSHLLFTIHFDVSSTSSGDGVNKNRSGCLHIIDLAGSERLDKSGSHGTLLTEAKHINTSLSALALVIEKLQAKKSSSDHIPFRDSKLTYLLRNSLGGDSKTLAIVCCSPHQAHFNESLNSIRFAANASKVELKEANKVNV